MNVNKLKFDQEEKQKNTLVPNRNSEPVSMLGAEHYKRRESIVMSIFS